MAQALHPAGAAPATETKLVLFDGVCGFCDRTVRWLSERDPEGRLRFAPLQGETAAGLRERLPELPSGVETLVLVEGAPGEERVTLRSEAVLRACAEIGALPPPVLRIARWLPRPLADLGYRMFVRVRYAIFGKLDSCRVPAPHERDRFLP